MDVNAYAVVETGKPLVPVVISRREPGPHDIVIQIAYAGICHSDIHQARGEWGPPTLPMVPGHEIAGVVTAVGSEVTAFAVGDHAGVGCMVDSCRECRNCLAGDENYCTGRISWTYNSLEADGVTATQGGYSTHVVVTDRFALTIPKVLPLDGAAPLLCAGITPYSPLRHWKVQAGTRVGVMGLGGLGHMAVKFARAMGAEVTMISHSPGKAEDADRLGAHHFLLSGDRTAMKSARHSMDFILNTVSADINLGRYFDLLDTNGTMCMVGAPANPVSVNAGWLQGGRRSLAGSLIGGIAQTQEMLDFAAEHGIVSDVEVISADQINEAYERVLASDVRYRFSIDASTLGG